MGTRSTPCVRSADDEPHHGADPERNRRLLPGPPHVRCPQRKPARNRRGRDQRVHGGQYSDPGSCGEADDWIELFNPTSEAIPLGGDYLSDDPLDPGKWAFPGGTTIDAGGYLIIWADDDAIQEGLHASFKLSAGGESVVFSNPDFSVVDSTSFGAQTTDHSMARIPNGTGPFRRHLGADTRSREPRRLRRGDSPVSLQTAIGPITPNPFRNGTVIGFSLAKETSVRLQVFDLQGRLLMASARRGDARRRPPPGVRSGEPRVGCLPLPAPGRQGDPYGALL
ncbi:MAG: lamin tail domain-containing protein [Candidatus Eisenbacteria bacterium]